jgi:hypothetical protein
MDAAILEALSGAVYLVFAHRDLRRYGTSSGKWTKDFVIFQTSLLLAESANCLAGGVHFRPRKA